MTYNATPSTYTADPIIIAQDVPAEVQDCGNVRMGGGIHMGWLAWEVLQYLPGLMPYWPNA